MTKQERLNEAVEGMTRFRCEWGLSMVDTQTLKRQGLKAGDRFRVRGHRWKVNRYAEGHFWVQRIV